MTFKVFLGLGSNLDDRALLLQNALEEISIKVGPISLKSEILETEPWGVTDQPNYLNQVICVHTELYPLALLNTIHEIETKAGRIRTEKWGSRTLDIDILYFENWHFKTPELQIPHPYIAERDFVLQPLFEIAPDFIHPTLMQSTEDLLKALY